ncbi:putative vomeronasal receptor-like protein 4 [Mesocricetus auratus]|uniref:Vomeronasal type-1 receptor n=1 Tax=Mesocricetus auratus TaxID=10036 RepID=A0A1U7R4Q4_MESAU|nr:putative vomeronasal receptor-like protein 4 [Mesocricetus auratus]
MSSLKNVLYFQVGLGVLNNMFLLFCYVFIILVHKSKLMDLISCQLTFIHIVLILSGEDIWLTGIFESLNFENDFKCKATFYVNRIMRSLSICITCLLSVFQAVTISPSTPLLAKFKHKLKKYMIYAFLFIWALNLSFSTRWIFYVGAFTNMSETNQIKITKYCSLLPMNYIIRAIILTVTTSRDAFIVGVMMTTSAYMVIILFRHQRQCKHLHSLSHLRASPEKRATQTILMLVVVFVVMYWVDFIISSSVLLLWMADPAANAVQKFVLNVYPTITPLVQISSDNRIINILQNTQLQCHSLVVITLGFNHLLEQQQKPEHGSRQLTWWWQQQEEFIQGKPAAHGEKEPAIGKADTGDMQKRHTWQEVSTQSCLKAERASG